MDEIDSRILDALKENGRATASEISKKVSLSIPAVTERIRKLEQSGIIQQYTVRLNQKAQGYSLMAFILVNLDCSEHTDQFRAQIVRERNVLECHHIAGPNDYLLKVLVADTDELEHFISHVLKKMKGVVSSNTFIRMSTLKEEMNL